MKKIIFILIILLSLIGFKAYANEVLPDETLEYDDYFNYLKPGDLFNYLIVSNDEYASMHYEHYNNKADEASISYNNLYATSTIRFYDNEGNVKEESEFKILYVMSKYSVNSIMVYINNKAILYLEMGVRTVIPHGNNYFDIAEYNQEYKYAVIGEYSFGLNVNNPYINFDDFYPAFLYSTLVEELDNEYINIDISNPLSKEDISYKVGIKDSNGNILPNYEIIDSNYDKDNLELKEYYIRLRSISNGNVYFKNINVIITDMASLIKTVTIEVSYDEKLSIYDFLNKTDVGFEYKSFTVTSDYFYSYNTLNKYEYIMYFTDLNDNTYYSKNYVEIKDYKKPYIKGEKIIYVEPTTLLEKSDVIDLINVYDEYDGKILNVELNGYIDYLKNYKNNGEYDINIVASDNSNNVLNEDIKIIVGEKEKAPINSLEIELKEDIKENNNEEEKEEIINPIDTTIIYSDYVIYSYTDHKLSMSEIQDLLISEGLLYNDDIVTFSGEYFNLESPGAGQYEILLSYISGKRVYYELSNNVKEIVDNDDNSSNSSFIVLFIIGGLVLSGIVVILIIRRKTNAKRS